MRLPSIPLLVHDPYFSIWSPADELHEADSVHWTGAKKRIKGTLTLEGETYRFMGSGDEPVLAQKELLVTPTHTIYIFETEKLHFELDFLSPLLLTDPDLASRPCTYIECRLRSRDGVSREAAVELSFDEEICYDGEAPRRLFCGKQDAGNYQSVYFGLAKQTPLGHSGDHVTVDWGYFYLALPAGVKGNVEIAGEGGRHMAKARLLLTADDAECAGYVVAAYDDILSVMYFDQPLKAYWARNGKNIHDMLAAAIREKESITVSCHIFDKELTAKAEESGGKEYALVCTAAYRQSIAAHKLAADRDGHLLFLSKECDSNGCMATVDISYPSIPLYLLYNKEFVRGMIRPVVKFASCPVWEHDFAPHDVGCYPYATGQVYGLDFGNRFETGDVYPLLYTFPGNQDLYPLRHEMPVEESGNMLIMLASVIRDEAFREEMREYLPMFASWAGYLTRYGADPEEQLCTDDFAGHLAKNVNLSAKAIVGIAAYGMVLEAYGDLAGAQKNQALAKNMAADWEARAKTGNHTRLTFDREDGWSLKYNVIWDLVLELGLFSKDMIHNEVSWYLEHQNQYGVMLDSRKTYTKSDWVLWSASLADDPEDRARLAGPVARYLMESRSRVPFSDWYDTITGDTCGFKHRSVVGGVFMLMLRSNSEK